MDQESLGAYIRGARKLPESGRLAAYRYATMQANGLFPDRGAALQAVPELVGVYATIEEDDRRESQKIEDVYQKAMNLLRN